MNQHTSHVASLQETAYVRERWAPKAGDPLYLHLSDLRKALEPVRSDGRIRILDFGAGGSPYRALFPNAEYCRADFPGGTDIDFVIGVDSQLDAESESFDLVLSTQVLEHCRNPAKYLAECLRVLRVGGRLVLSTHGTYEDHACPHDYYRWTGDGLKLALEDAGFAMEMLQKLTSGPRALIYLARTRLWDFITGDRSIAALWMRLFRYLVHRYGRAVDEFCDRAFPPETRICDTLIGPAGPVLYVCVLAVACKKLGNGSATGGQ